MPDEEMKEVSMDYLWTAVCSGDLATVEEYYTAGGNADVRYAKFGDNHSLIMGALRNGQVEMIRLLCSHGEDIEDFEEDEYRKLIEPLYEKYNKSEIEQLKTGHGLHFNLEIEDDRSYTSRCPEFPGFKGAGKRIDMLNVYYELCEWLRNHPGAHRVEVEE